MSDCCTQFVCNVGDPWWLLEAAVSAASSGKTELNCVSTQPRMAIVREGKASRVEWQFQGGGRGRWPRGEVNASPKASRFVLDVG